MATEIRRFYACETLDQPRLCPDGNCICAHHYDIPSWHCEPCRDATSWLNRPPYVPVELCGDQS